MQLQRCIKTNANNDKVSSQLSTAEKNRNLPDTHGKSVDVFVKLVRQSDGLDDHIVGPVDIKLDFCSGVAVTKAQLGFRGGLGGQTLHQGVKVKTHTLWKKNSVCLDLKK